MSFSLLVPLSWHLNGAQNRQRTTWRKVSQLTKKAWPYGWEYPLQTFLYPGFEQVAQMRLVCLYLAGARDAGNEKWNDPYQAFSMVSFKGQVHSLIP